MGGLSATPSGRDVVEVAGKRERLVAAARDLVHRRGWHRTTLAEIAEAALVPPGNVYYYFKTKDELLRAMIDDHLAELRVLLSAFEQDRDPRARLKAYVRFHGADSDVAARYGCPFGSLGQELAKADDGDGRASRLMRPQVAWVEQQFASMDMGSRAAELAVELVSRVQGATLLANALRDPALLTTEARRLQDWIDAVHLSSYELVD